MYREKKCPYLSYTIVFLLLRISREKLYRSLIQVVKTLLDKAYHVYKSSIIYNRVLSIRARYYRDSFNDSSNKFTFFLIIKDSLSSTISYTIRNVPPFYTNSSRYYDKITRKNPSTLFYIFYSYTFSPSPIVIKDSLSLEKPVRRLEPLPLVKALETPLAIST